MKMRTIAALTMAAAMVFGIAGCGNSNAGTTAGTSAEATTAASAEATTAATTAGDDGAAGSATGTITITGSTSVEKVLNALKDEFEAMNPGTTINYSGTGSSAGIQDTINGVNNIGAVSREVTEEEKGSGIQEAAFAIDGIAVIVNPANEVKDLTMAQLQDIYSGKITNWKEVGGKDGEILVVSREESSGTRSGFEELVGINADKGVKLTDKVTIAEGNGPVQLAVAQNESAIGYVSFEFIDDSVKGVNVEGIEPIVENVNNDTYKLKRPFLFVYKDDAALTETGKAFLDFALSEDGQQIVTDNNSIPVK